MPNLSHMYRIFGHAKTELILFKEAQAIIDTHLSSQAFLEETSALRLYEIMEALRDAPISDAAKKSFRLVLQHAATHHEQSDSKRIYTRLENDFCEGCPELFEVNAQDDVSELHRFKQAG